MVAPSELIVAPSELIVAPSELFGSTFPKGGFSKVEVEQLYAFIVSKTIFPKQL